MEGRPKRVRTTVITDRTKAVMQENVRSHVDIGSQIHSVDAGYYRHVDDEYLRGIVTHAEAQLQGNVHTNGLKHFWSLLKRGLGGTYISVEPFDLFRYLDEQAFRYNNRRDMNDSHRFDLAVRQIVGRRLAWAEVTGKQPDARPQIN